MLDPEIDLVKVQLLFLAWQFNDDERKWQMKNERKNHRTEPAKAEPARPRAECAEAKPQAAPPPPGWPPHRRFWHSPPREFRVDRDRLTVR